MKNNSLIGILLLVVISLWGCQKDDICSGATPTTPLLVIKFLDIENPIDAKTVNRLQVYDQLSVNPLFDSPVTDSIIKIPLQTGQNNTKFIFKKDIPANPEGIDNANADSLQFTYAPVEEYVNRACGFKIVFYELEAFLTPENQDDNWIKNFEVIQPNNILNEQETHLYIYH